VRVSLLSSAPPPTHHLESGFALSYNPKEDVSVVQFPLFYYESLKNGTLNTKTYFF
jgi:hypothetical protein